MHRTIKLISSSPLLACLGISMAVLPISMVVGGPAQATPDTPPAPRSALLSDPSRAETIHVQQVGSYMPMNEPISGSALSAAESASPMGGVIAGLYA